MKLTHLLLVILVAALASVATVKYVVLPASPTAAKKETAYERVMRTGVLRCAYVIYPPLFDKDVNTGKFSGVMFDLVEALGKQMNIKIDWAEEVGTDNAFAGITTGRYDAICPGFWINPQRAAVANFAAPFYYQGVYAFARANDTRFDSSPTTINTPETKIVVMEGEMSQLIAADNFPNAQIITQPGTAGAANRMMDVASGKADVTFNEMSVYQQYASANPTIIKSVYKSPIRISASAIAFPKSDFDLIEMINANIGVMHNIGTVEKILAKYDPEGYEYLRIKVPYALPNNR